MSVRVLLACAVGAVMAITASEPTGAQVRSLDEVKKEVLRRAGKINPFNHIRPDDAKRIVASLTSLRFSIVSGGVACAVGAVAIVAAIPSLVRYDSSSHVPVSETGGVPDA